MKVLTTGFEKSPRIQAQSKTQLKIENKPDAVSFSGLHGTDCKALFAFDLDGTLIEGSNENIEKIIQIQKDTNAVLTYATGQTLVEFGEKQVKYKSRGINIPTPDYLIANNGQFIYKNINGELVLDKKWHAQIKEKTGFDKNKIYDTILDIAHRPEYKYSERELEKIKNLSNYSQRLAEDPDFIDSKISYYDWNPSEFNLQYFVAADVDINKLERTISKELKKNGIKAKFMTTEYPKEIVDGCPGHLINQIKPMRVDSKGKITSLFVSPQNKSDGIKYVAKKLNIANNEIVMAGNDGNDISMANMTKLGAFFICVGNSSKLLKEYVSKIFSPNTLSVENSGNAGIIEGLGRILNSEV